jgi:hypothetical protein
LAARQGTKGKGGGDWVKDAEPWHGGKREQWVRNLCVDGDVNWHPGPRVPRGGWRKELRVVNINLGGATGAWKALD